MRLRGLSVVVNLQAEPQAGLQKVEEEVLQALYTYLNPLVGGSAAGPSTGWPFGRLLNQGELYQIVHSVEGVQFVKVLRVYETNLVTGEQEPQPAGSHIVLEPDELVASAHMWWRRAHRNLVGIADGDNGPRSSGTREITGFITYSGEGLGGAPRRREGRAGEPHAGQQPPLPPGRSARDLSGAGLRDAASSGR